LPPLARVVCAPKLFKFASWVWFAALRGETGSLQGQGGVYPGLNIPRGEYWTPDPPELPYNVSTVMNVLLSLLLAAASTQDDLSRLVSAEVKAASAPVAISELSKQIGYPLEAMPSTKDDILIIRVEKAPLRTVMDKIARATNTTWEKTGSGQRLVRNADTLRAEAIAESAEFQAEVEVALEKLRKDQIKAGEMNERTATALANQMFDWQERQSDGSPMNDYQTYQRLQGSLPINRISRTLVASLDAKSISAIPMGRRWVFSSHPNRLQRPFPGNMLSLWQSYVREQTVWNKAFAEVRDRRSVQERYFMGGSGSLARASTGKLVLGVTRNHDSNSVLVNVFAIDSLGRVIATANESLSPEAMNQFRFDPTKLGADEKPIQFQGMTKRVFQAMQEAYASARKNGGQPDMEVAQDVKLVLVQPEKYEPLSLLVSDALIETAKAKSMNLVCSASDNLFMAVGLGAQGDVKPSQVLAILPVTGSRSDTKDGWITIGPKVPSYARRARASRVALGQFYRQCVREGRVSIDNHANFAFRSGLEEQSFMPMVVLTLTGVLRAGAQYGSEWTALRLFGSLNASQKQAVRREQPILLRSFSPDQLEIIRHHLFDRSYAGFDVSVRSEDRLPEDGDGPRYGFNNDATEVLPNGLIGTELFSISDKNEPMFFSTPDEEGTNGIRFGETPLTSQGVAYEIFQKERPEMFPWRVQNGFPQRTFSKFRLGTQRTIAVRAEMSPRAALNMQLQERAVSGSAVPLDKLPEPNRRLILDELAKLREQYKNMNPPEWNPGGGGQKTPPPN
jgi:hypothetical protein